MKNPSEEIKFSPEAAAAGIVNVRKLVPFPDLELIYIVVDSEKMDDNYLAKQAKSFWILAKYFCKNETNEPIPQTS